MIRNETEYREAVERLKAEKARMEAHRIELAKLGLKPAEIQRAVDPMESFHLQLLEEVEAYDRLKRGEFSVVKNFHGVGQLLIALRIAKGMSQRDLAGRLGVHESQVSRDERNEYHGVTLERAAKILEALGVQLISRVEQDSTLLHA
jgi:ribosome-binding protein aMBF1 (putative translation factor)